MYHCKEEGVVSFFVITFFHIKEQLCPKKVLKKNHFILSNLYPVLQNIVIFTHIIKATIAMSKRRRCKYCLEEFCFISRIGYSLKEVIPWNLKKFHLIICVPNFTTFCYFYTHNHCNYIIVKNKALQLLFGRLLCHLRDQLRTKIRNPLAIFESFHFMICVPHFTKFCSFYTQD